MNEGFAYVDRFLDAVVNPIIKLLFAVALLVFIFGAVRFVLNANSDTERTQGKKAMGYGVIGFFVMLSAYFIIGIIKNTFGI
jgi:uncharacterized membrane protein YbhN (UPF0104 family)